MSVIKPFTAVSAAVAGLAKKVLEPGPCLPSKFLLDVETQYLPFGILSSFIARQAEQPGCLNSKPPRKPKSQEINFFNHNIKSQSIFDLELTSSKFWEKKIIKYWNIGESFASKLMNDFFSIGIQDYSEGRNFPIRKNVSRLSPYLHWGQISPHTLWYEVSNIEQEVGEKNAEIFKSELGWREFFYNLLYHFPKIQKFNLQTKFDKFPWENNNSFFDA